MAGRNGKGPEITSDPAVAFQQSKRREELVAMPEWSSQKQVDDGEPVLVLVRAMDAPTRRAFIANGTLPDPQDTAKRIRNVPWWEDAERETTMIFNCVVRENGERFFTRAQARDLVDADDPVPYMRLVAAGDRVNVFDNDSFEAARKNSWTPRSASSSNLPRASESPAST